MDIEGKGFTPESENRGTTSFWQMSKADFSNWYEQKYDSFGPDTDYAAGRTLLRKEVLSLIPADNPLASRIDTEYWYLGNYNENEMLDIIHRIIIEDAMHKGWQVPDVVLADYPELLERVEHGRIAEENKEKVDLEIKNKILEDFDKVDLSSRREFTKIKEHFGKILPEVVISEQGNAVTFSDSKTGLTYVTIYVNAMIPRDWRDHFDYDRGVNYPVDKVEKLAVVIMSGKGKYATIEKGKIKN